MNKFGLYVHIPFCKKKCKYCDFISFSSCEEKVDEYIECLIKEIEYRKCDKLVSTIYIGGGTPSLIDSKYISKILKTIYSNFNVLADCEITIEINPGTITEKKLIDYKDAGINRLSIGLQSTEDRILELIGRIHNYEDFCQTYEIARKVGFKNINVDLMLAIPTQTEEELIGSVNKIIKLNPEHISLYSLILEDGTELEKLISKKMLELVDENTERMMYWKTKKILEKNGYNHYEISNFSKKGFESKHNVDCWNQEEYFGMGVSAHSYFQNRRFSNTEKLKQYIENLKNEKYEKNIEVHEEQDKSNKMKEFMMIGLRKIEGIKISDFERKFRINPLFYFRFEIDELTNKGLIEIDLDNIKLTSKGLDFANQVFELFA